MLNCAAEGKPLADALKAFDAMRQIRTRPVRPGPPQLSRFSAAVLAALARKTKYVDPQLAANWPSVVGDEIARLCRPGRLTGGRGRGGGRTLEIVAPNGAAAAQVQFVADTIVERANRLLGPGAVARIAIRQEGGRAGAAGKSARPSVGLESALNRMQASLRRRESD